MSSTSPLVLAQAEARRLLQQVDVYQAMRQMFLDLAAGEAVQPAQQLVEFPNGAGDFINYLGVLGKDGVYGVKTSPYIRKPDGALVTAWTLLMSMDSGQPLLLCDASELTTARTAATTAVAVEALAPERASRLALIGSGLVARAHLHYVKGLRDWQCIAAYSPSLAADVEVQAQLRAQDPRVKICASLEDAVAEADVVMLCTSSAGPVLDPRSLGKTALVTSISTNAPRAHEVPPQALGAMDVYCDYRATTPGSAGEMLLATEHHGWSREAIRGDLPELLSGKASRPDYRRPVFFRSIGLGLEDMALANALYHLQCQGQ
ncbi:ornithine cyclodeaminase family protein [Metapseudomonas sp. CR1201]